MKITVIVNSYNYGRYIGETLDSVLAQTLPAQQVLVVDDGSKDDSCAVIAGYAEKHPHLTLISKENGGQLSTFNAAAPHVEGDLVFFLDSDDQWQPTYLETITAIYRERPIDFVCCAFEEFGESNKINRKYTQDTDLGFSVAFTFFKKVCIGWPTACLSLRRTLFDKIFPIPLEEDWRVCADLPLATGASLAGGHKFYCASPLVLYRVHPINATKVLQGVSDYAYRFPYTRDVLINHFCSRFHLTEKGCAELLCDEVLVAREDMNLSLFWRHLTALFKSHRPLLWKLGEGAKMVKKMLKQRRR